MRIDIVEDETAPEGGRAKLVLPGVHELPAALSFRIVCLDPHRIDDPQDWPHGERTPIEMRHAPEGLELIVGPDVVDAPALMPGTPVRIVIPALGIEQELFWPSLKPSMSGASAPTVLASVDDLVAAAVAREQGLADTVVAPGTVTASAAEIAALAAGATVAATSKAHDVSVSETAKTLAVTGSPGPRVSAASGQDRKPVEARQPTKPSGKGSVPLSLAFAAGALMALLTASTVGYGLKLGPWASPAQTAPSRPVATAALADVFPVGALSPRGRRAEGVELETLLDLAEFSLHSDKSDPEEAQFWLRRALADTIGNDRFVWALTQLGTTYAAAEGAVRDRHLSIARQLWELAAALGDPLASCFLATLYEKGLGAPRDEAIASRHREAARAGGTCPQDLASDGPPRFWDPRRLPPAGITSPAAVAAEAREWARERQELKRALSDAYGRHKQDADKLAALTADVKSQREEIARLNAELDERVKSARAWSSHQSQLSARLEEAEREQARLAAALAAERERRAVAEEQLSMREESEAFNAALATARRLAAELAKKSQ